MKHTDTFARWAAICVLIFSALYARTFACADDDFWTFALAPSISRSELKAIVPRLNISAHEEAAVQDACNLFFDKFDREAGKVRRQVDRANAGETDIDQEYFAQWPRIRLELEDQLEMNVHALLTNEEGVKIWWREMARARRAYVMKTLRMWYRKRQAVDLAALIEPLKLANPEIDRLTTLLETYEREMDQRLRVLVIEQISMGNAQRAYAKKHPGQGNTFSVEWRTFLAAFNTHEALMQQVADINQASAILFADGLEPANRTTFLESYDRWSYPEAFEPCPVELAMESIRLSAEVTPEQRQAAELIFETYMPARDALRQQILTTVRKWENNHPKKAEMIEHQKRREAENMSHEEHYQLYVEIASQHPINALLQRRHEQALEALGQIKDVFAQDEFQKLPVSLRLCFEGLKTSR